MFGNHWQVFRFSIKASIALARKCVSLSDCFFVHILIKLLDVESPFQVRRGPITVRNVLDELKGVRCRSPQDRTITQEDILCHLIFAFVDGDGHRHFLTIYRSENADDVVELCQRCRDCCLLFRYIDSE